MNIGREHLQYAVNRGKALQRRLEGLKERLEGTTKKVVTGVEVATGGLLGGLIQGRAGGNGAHIFHVPADLLIGIGLVGGGLFDVAGEHSYHLTNFGTGFVAAFTSSIGFAWGRTWRETGKFSFSASPSPAELPAPTASKGEISPQQMADIVARVHAAAQR